MNTVQDVSSRFINAVSYLINNNSVKDKKSLAQILGISVSMLTEISKGRSNVGVSSIQNIVMKFNVSSEWLITGKGEMFLTENPPIPPQKPLQQEESEYILSLKDNISALKEVISTQRELIDSLRMQLGEK